MRNRNAGADGRDFRERFNSLIASDQRQLIAIEVALSQKQREQIRAMEARGIDAVHSEIQLQSRAIQKEVPARLHIGPIFIRMDEEMDAFCVEDDTGTEKILREVENLGIDSFLLNDSEKLCLEISFVDGRHGFRSALRNRLSDPAWWWHRARHRNELGPHHSEPLQETQPPMPTTASPRN